MNLDRPESEIETSSITLLLPQAIEATIYSADLVEQIAASMAQFGFEGACLRWPTMANWSPVMPACWLQT